MAGITVTLLDKEARTGGNSAKASSGINGVYTKTQKANGIEDSLELFSKDTVKSGHGRSNETLVGKLTSESTQAVTWLQEQFGLDLDVLAQLGGHSRARTHRRPDINGKPQPVGWGIVSTLAKHLAEHDPQRFSLVTGARVTELVQKNSRVTGVVYQTAETTEKLDSDIVVLATGGFAGEGRNADLLQKYAPQLVGLPATNGPFATGDGMKLAAAVGAQLVDMDQVQVHPTGFVKRGDAGNPTKFLAAEALRGDGGVLLTGQGRRFVNELETRDKVTDAINQHCTSDLCARYPGDYIVNEPQAAAYLVLSEQAADKFGHGALGFYQKMGLFQKADNLQALAEALRVERETLSQALTGHDQARRSGNDEFGKHVFPADAVSSGGYYWGVVTPSLHYTMGGVRFDEHARVLRADGSPIHGLLAAGEVTGGLHGANRLGGNSLLECVVFGREAGRQAALAVSS
ncbi:cleavage and polyadenylation specificity factor subunit 2 [Linderina pennispora]|nr:cleavage and polyadenylation specificity factor subunit 2 [Linderina pennispora]